MAANTPKHVTLCQDSFHGDREFVVACKGRPFVILTSSNLPTPAITLVDHKLITELKLRISDLQCTKFHYGGKKLRILGKISTSVQCIMGGMVSGNMHIKASVVENLYDHFDAHSIAGNKLSQHLAAPPDRVAHDMATNSPEPTTPKKSKKTKVKSNTPSVSNSQSGQSTPSAHTSWTPSPTSLPSSLRPTTPPPIVRVIAAAKKSPDYSGLYSPSAPIFRTVTAAKMSPDYSGLYSPTAPISAAVRTSPDHSMSPPGFPYPRYTNTTRGNTSQLPQGCHSPSINIACLTAMGGSADGANPGPILYPGHGPYLCTPGCRCADPPLNCGYNPQWQLPPNFQLCGRGCRGGFCECLRGYDADGHYGWI